MTSDASSTGGTPVGVARLALRDRDLVVPIRLVVCGLARWPARVLAAPGAEATG